MSHHINAQVGESEMAISDISISDCFKNRVAVNDFFSLVEIVTYWPISFVNITQAGITIAPKVFLQGAYSTQGHNDALRVARLIPTTEPFTAAGYPHIRTGGGETTSSSVLNRTGANAVVDWIIVELRSASNNRTVVATRSALLLRNGHVVDTDGTSAVRFSGMEAGSYYVAIRHRNHLGVMSAMTVDLQ